jgi:hypothetical protein
MVTDLRSSQNSGCITKCNRDDRKLVTEDDICLLTLSVLDSGPVRCVGDWAYEKIHWLTRYFDIFSTGMRDHWEGLNYIEICSGPGRCILRESGEEVDGTALSIINSSSFAIISKGLFIDNGPRRG